MEILDRTSTNRVTLRLQNDILDILKREASKTDLTLNAFINKVLNKNITYEENVNAILNVVFPHDFFLLIVDKLQESDIKELAYRGPGVVKKLFNVIGMQYDIDHIIHNYFAVIGKYCKWFEFSHKVSYNKYRLVFCADATTPKWTLFLRLYIKSILESAKVLITDESQNDGIIVFEFTHKG
ncbi:MAG TPA: hypothetical protein VJ792_06615 [Candidatus Nitrosotalea sp.]|nr:hypothetical protein [Candidatus Nitrosotalea sp.]